MMLAVTSSGHLEDLISDQVRFPRRAPERLQSAWVSSPGPETGHEFDRPHFAGAGGVRPAGLAAGGDAGARGADRADEPAAGGQSADHAGALPARHRESGPAARRGRATRPLPVRHPEAMTTVFT